MVNFTQVIATLSYCEVLFGLFTCLWIYRWLFCNVCSIILPVNSHVCHFINRIMYAYSYPAFRLWVGHPGQLRLIEEHYVFCMKGEIWLVKDIARYFTQGQIFKRVT